MQVVSADLIAGKRVLLRYDIDVALECKAGSAKCKVKEDYKLKAGLETLKLCLENASKTIIIGHLGRPFATAEDEKSGNPEDLSAKPIQEWFEKQLGKDVEFAENLEKVASSNSKLVLLENIRFFHGEVEGDIDFAKSLAGLGEVYVNEAFSSHNPAASTTILPTLFPHVEDPEGHLRPRRAAGLRFVKEVETLLNVRNNPKKPFVAVMGGAKVNDKLPVIKILAKKADAVLVGGKLVAEIREQDTLLPKNVLVGKLNQDGFDIAEETTQSWRNLIANAAQIIWNGPLGKFEDPKYDQTKKVAEMILDSDAEILIGGGDTIAALNSYNLLDKFVYPEPFGYAQAKLHRRAFVSVGGGAMLKLLADGTLPTIEALLVRTL